jgi:hypothetical protein
MRIKKIKIERIEKPNTYSPKLLIKAIKIPELKNRESKVIAKSKMTAMIKALVRNDLRIIVTKISCPTRSEQKISIETIKIQTKRPSNRSVETV